MLALGIPTSPITAVLIGALMMHGVSVGPTLVNEHPDVFWGFVASMYVGNLMLLALNLPLVSLFVTVLRIPYAYLYPLIIMFCIIGVYEVNNSIVDVWIMLIMGVLGYALRKFEFDPAPLVLGLVIAPIFEQSLRQSLIMSNGNYMIFFTPADFGQPAGGQRRPAGAVGAVLHPQARDWRAKLAEVEAGGAERADGADAEPHHRSRAAVGRPDGDRAHRRDAEGRHLPADADRSRPRRCATGSRRSAEALGCTVTVDDMGTMFARRAGHARRRAADRDRQPSRHPADRRQVRRRARRARRRSRRCARWYEAGYETYAPIEVVNWTNEEGSRFAPAMLASGVFAGVFTRDWALRARGPRRQDLRRRRSTRSAIAGPSTAATHPLSAFFELHIEQGPILEAEGKDIGVVTGVQAMRWYEVTVTGQDSAHRRDADARCARTRCSAPRGWSRRSTRSRASMRRARSAPSG